MGLPPSLMMYIEQEERAENLARQIVEPERAKYMAQEFLEVLEKDRRRLADILSRMFHADPRIVSMLMSCKPSPAAGAGGRRRS